MPIRFVDEQPVNTPKGKIRFLDEPTQPEKTGSDNFSGYGVSVGVLDPVYGAGQLIPRALEKITSLGGLAENPVSRAYGRSAENVDKGYKQVSSEYEAQRQSPKDFDWGRLTGNVASPINWLGTGAGGATTGLGGKMAVGAGVGAGSAASMPVQNTNNYWGEKAQQAGLGATGGAAAPLVGSAIGRVLNPQTAPEVKSMLKEGVKLTAGEIAGGAVKRAEDIMGSIPVVGSIVKGAQTRSIESLNKAAINRSLSPIGKSLPKDINMGREAIEYANNELSQAYDNLLPKLTGKVDSTFISDLNNLSNMVQSDYIMNDASKQAYGKILNELVVNRLSNNGSMTGQAIKEIEGNLGELSIKLAKSNTPSDVQLSSVLKETQKTLRGMVERANPQYAKELNAINEGYANFKRVQKASTSAGAQEGVFTPSQLQAAVRGADKTKDKAAFARGQALMQDLSDPAKSRMLASIPNSGTVDRALGYGVAATGGTALLNPWTAPLGAAALAYTPAGRKMAEILLTQRPDVSRKIGGAVSKYAPYLSAPAAIPLAKESGY